MLLPSITPFTVTYHESLFTALSVIQTFSKFRNPKVPFTGCKLDQFLLLKYLLSVCFSMRVFSEVHKKSSRMQIPLLVQCSTHSDSLFTQVFKGSAVNPSLGTSQNLCFYLRRERKNYSNMRRPFSPQLINISDKSR